MPKSSSSDMEKGNKTKAIFSHLFLLSPTLIVILIKSIILTTLAENISLLSSVIGIFWYGLMEIIIITIIYGLLYKTTLGYRFRTSTQKHIIILLFAIFTSTFSMLVMKSVPFYTLDSFNAQVIKTDEKFQDSIKKAFEDSIYESISVKVVKSEKFIMFARSNEIVLSEGVINNYSTEEIVAGFAHEVAHIYLWHSLKEGLLILFFMLCGVIVLMTFWKLFDRENCSEKHKVKIQRKDVFSYLSLFFLFILISKSGYIQFQKQFEKEADIKAVEFLIYKGYGVDKFKSFLTGTEKSGQQFNSITKLLFLNHPTLEERLDLIQKTHSHLKSKNH